MRNADRAAKREAERVAQIEAERAAREAIRLADEARRALPPLGPPTLGFFSRLAIGFVAGLMLTAAIAMPLALADHKNGPLIAVIVGGAGLIISLITSLVCAALVTAVSQKTIGHAMLWGTVGATLGLLVVPAMTWVAKPMIVLLSGAFIGFVVGTADQLSREREAGSGVRGPG
jgi:hypothetical protein